MAKKMFYSMGEVTEMFDVNASLIRHWESKFDILRPHKNKKGNRLFTPEDVEHLKLIYHLVKERGMTLEGARRALGRGNRAVMTRDMELLERLQRIRAQLVEVRDELKSDPAADGTVVVDSPLPAEDEGLAAHSGRMASVAAEPASSAEGNGGREASAAKSSRRPRGAKSGGAATDAMRPEDPPQRAGTSVPGGFAAGASSQEVSAGGDADVADALAEKPAEGTAAESAAPGAPRRRASRRRKEEEAARELFAFYEQSLF